MNVNVDEPQATMERLRQTLIGLGSRIVHDYMRIDMAVVLRIVRDERYRIVT